MLVFTVVVEGRDSKAAVGPQLDGDPGPALADQPHQPFEDGHHTITGVDGAGSQDGGDELIGVPIEDEERVVHVLAEVAVVALPLLLPMHRIVGPIQVQQDAPRPAQSLPFGEIDADQGLSQAVAGLGGGGILQAGQRRLTGQIRIVTGQPTTNQLQQRIGPELVGVVLVRVATGDLEDALANQGLQRVPHRAMAPVGDDRRERRTQPELLLGLGEPDQTTVRGRRLQIEAGHHRQQGSLRERDGRLTTHRGTSWHRVGFDTRTHTRTVPRCHLMNNSG